MITVVSASNRLDSMTRIVAENIQARLLDALEGQDVHLLALDSINTHWMHTNMYSEQGQDPVISMLQDSLILPAQKLLFVIPEYNGSFPGVLKAFVDAISIRHYKQNFYHKKVGLIGVASGRSGNVRGMDHFCAVMQHQNAIVFPQKLPISQIEKHYANGELSGETLKAIDSFLNAFVSF